MLTIFPLEWYSSFRDQSEGVPLCPTSNFRSAFSTHGYAFYTVKGLQGVPPSRGNQKGCFDSREQFATQSADPLIPELTVEVSSGEVRVGNGFSFTVDKAPCLEIQSLHFALRIHNYIGAPVTHNYATDSRSQKFLYPGGGPFDLTGANAFVFDANGGLTGFGTDLTFGTFILNNNPTKTNPVLLPACREKFGYPTESPTYAPTKNPTYAPTKNPTYAPTKNPTYAPTKNPTM